MLTGCRGGVTPEDQLHLLSSLPKHANLRAGIVHIGSLHFLRQLPFIERIVGGERSPAMGVCFYRCFLTAPHTFIAC